MEYKEEIKMTGWKMGERGEGRKERGWRRREGKKTRGEAGQGRKQGERGYVRCAGMLE